MEKCLNIIYLISNNLQDNKIKNAKILEETILEEHEIYQQLSDLIIDNIIEKNFINNSYLKSELVSYQNKMINMKNKIYNIYIDEILSLREITEIDNLETLNKELYDMLSIYDNNEYIIVVDYKLVKYIKALINKEKIYKKIYFITDFNKPIMYIIKEFYAIMH